jgi:hypothetical protein
MVIAAVLTLQVSAVSAQAPREERVSFKPGSSSATINGSIQGEDSIDYVLGARAGQTMSVTLKSSNGANSFNVLPPGSEAAIAIGENLGNTWSGTLPADGNYRIRVFLMRSAARRKEAAKYTLSVAITGQADAKVGRTPFHATGTVPCSVGPDPKGGSQCPFGVIRSGPGRAEVHLVSAGFDVMLHKNQVRVLRFAGATVTSATATEKVTAEKQGDNWSIAVNGFYYYTIPEAVISGG